MFKGTNHAQSPSRDRFKLSLLPWSASPSKIMIWKSSCAKRTQALILRRKTKKALALREGTKKGWRVAMPQADQKDRIQAGHPSQIWLHLT